MEQERVDYADADERGPIPSLWALAESLLWLAGVAVIYGVFAALG